jgi:argininosuccinate lyase
MTSRGGRFEEPLDEGLLAFSSSLELDLGMLDEDLEGSIAHATMLGECGLLTADESAAIVAGLGAIRDEHRRGVWSPDPRAEDVHLAVEARLVERLGEVGRKLHTARSRNDQVATDVRLWLKRRLPVLDASLARLIGVLADRVEADGRTLIPGYTHLQRGQPILLGHHLLAHAWPLRRDRGRLADALARLDLSPLGACAMAGTEHPIDRERTAALLGFADVVPNAMDAVAARDHLQEVAAACAIAMAHLSRMAEELVLWSSSEFRLVRLAEAWTTGSSIMPQKRNPDGAELVRGQAGRVFGDLQALLVLVKALPLAYNRDLQQDREPLFHAVETTRRSADVIAGCWRTLEIDAARFESELRGDFLLATELADGLVRHGVAFRTAHEIVGRLVRWCEQQGKGLDAVTPEVARRFHEALADGLAERLDPRAAAERRRSLGGTAWSEIERQLQALRRSPPATASLPPC